MKAIFIFDKKEFEFSEINDFSFFNQLLCLINYHGKLIMSNCQIKLA